MTDKIDELLTEQLLVDQVFKEISKYKLTNISQIERDLTIAEQTLHNVKKYVEEKNNCDYYNYSFADKSLRLSEEQYSCIIQNIKSNVRILACPGSGKTTTLICRVKYLIDHNVDPKTIMLTTFNVDASQNMKNKLTDLFGFMPNITIGTIDSIACKYYNKYFKADYHVGVAEYTTKLLEFLETDVKKNILNKFKYIFFDEFQDINDIQFKIIQIFHKHGTYINVIGDDAQSIYHWRGANIDYILNFDKYIDNVTTFTLKNNYRSTPEIIDFANNSIKYNTDQIPKQMISHNRSVNFRPVIQHFSNAKWQNQGIIGQIINFYKRGVKLDDIAIIARNNFSLKLIEEEISKYCNDHKQIKLPFVALITDFTSDTKPKIKEGHLTLTTIYKAKGLEWKVVFMIGCNDKFFPAEIDNISIQEERRAFFVGITRAKQYLYIYFTDDTITRFIKEIPRPYYNFIDFDEKYFNYSDGRNNKYDIEVTKLIHLLQEKDLVVMRKLNLLPKLKQEIIKIHEDTTYHDNINNYYLHADFGEFIDRYITRKIGEKHINSGALYDKATVNVIGSIGVDAQEYQVYKKYNPNFKLNMYNIHESMTNSEIINEFNKQDINNIILKVASNDTAVVISLIKKILDTKCDINSLTILQKNYLPQTFREKILESYKCYQDANYKNADILEDIYNISLCGNVINERRRLLYKNVFDIFTEKFNFGNIDKYLEMLPNLLECKTVLHNKKYDIIGELDLLDISNHKIIDYKCSASQYCKLEWILQLLTYSALYQLETGIKIQTIEVYNPLQGLIFRFNLSDWNNSDELLKFLNVIRTKRMKKHNNEQDNMTDDNLFDTV